MLKPAQVERIQHFLPEAKSRDLTTRMGKAQRQALLLNLRSLRDALIAYLPRYLVEVIRADPTPGQVGCYFKHGTVMFADVSGFTAMSEKLSALGKEGAEEMTGIVNDYFEAMLQISESMGGDLLKFGGDALMIFFEGGQGAIQALSTGGAMQEAMDEFAEVKTSQGVFPLRMSIGMASGPITLLNIGSAQEMHYTVMGRTLGRMAKMEELATAGQVVADEQTMAAGLQIANFDGLEGGAFLLGTLSQTYQAPMSSAFDRSEPDQEGDNLLAEVELLEALSPYVPDELLIRLIADPNQPARRGSHRPVTNMFANFIGLDALVEDLGVGREKEILAIANAYLAPMGQILDRFGGTVSRLDTYSTGQRILALFGALQAHEDDPERAVRAGVEMSNAMGSVNKDVRDILAEVMGEDTKSEPLTQRIGINTGFVFAGSVGASHRREYTVMGAQVNLTARLMSIAKEGKVLIGNSTARHVVEKFVLEEQEAVKVKGISEAVKNFVVGAEIAAQARLARLAATPLQGREVELNRSREIAQEVLGDHGRMLLISGESGIGKSRLIDEIVTEVTHLGMEVLDGACLSYGRTMTYHPWAEVLRQLFGLSPEQSPEERIQLMIGLMQEIGQELFAPVIGQVMGLPIEDNDLTRDLDAKLRRQRVLDLVLQLLQTRSKAGPLLVLIEDVHWADDASRDLIEYVGRNIGLHPILFLLSHRPEEGLPNWGALPGAHALALTGLSAEACIALARQILNNQSLSARLETFVLEKGSGNPLFLGEVIRNLIDAGSIQPDAEGIWDLPEGVEVIELPDTIHGMIISRMDRLEPLDRKMLQVAAVIGRSFSTPTLTGVYSFDLGQSSLIERIGELSEKGLVERMEEGDRFRFTHLTTQEVVYESLSYELRRDLHCRIGEHYEVVNADSLSEWVDLLAYHYYEGHAWPKAASYNLRAGQRAQREYANEGAISAMHIVLDSASKLDTTQEADLASLPAHEALGEVYTLVGEYDQALEHLSLARGIQGVKLESDAQIRGMAELMRKTADVYERQGSYEQAFAWLERALDDLDGVQAGLETARIYLMGAGIHHRQGQNEEAVAWCLQSLETARSIEDRESTRVIGQAYYLQGAAYNRLSRFSEASHACLESIRYYEEIDDLLGQARAYNNLANVYSDLGEWGKSSDAYHRSMEINQRIGNIQEQGFVANNLGNIHLYRGDWDRADELFRKSNAIWKRIGAPLPDAVTLSNLAQVQIYRQQWKQAGRTLEESQTIFERLGSEDFLSELYRRWAEYHLGIDQMEEAINYIQHSIDLAEKHDARLEKGMSLRVLGQIEMTQGSFDSANHALVDSLAILEDLNAEYELAKTRLALAKLAHKRGDKELAMLDDALEAFTRLGAAADVEQARALL